MARSAPPRRVPVGPPGPRAPAGHVRQAGGNSELEAEAPRVQRHRWKGWLPWVRLQAAIDGMADCAAAAAPLSSPAPAAHRCAAAGLDSGAAAAILASMPSTPQWIA